MSAVKQHVWVLDQNESHYGEVRDALAGDDVVVSFFTSLEATLAAAKSPQSRLPRVLVLDQGFVEPLLKGPPQNSPRAALLRHAPFVLVGSMGEAEGLALGAAHCARRPVHTGDLTTKIRQCLQQRAVGPDEIAFNVGALNVTFRGREPAALTPREFQILALLYHAANHTASRSDLFANVWSGVKVCNKVLDVHVSKLRKKLLGLGIGIHFIRPASYRLELNVPAGGQSDPTERHGAGTEARPEPLVAVGR